MKPQTIKNSEARILIYLSQVPPINRNVAIASRKLSIGYGYCCILLNDMAAKGWVKKVKSATGRTFYEIGAKCPKTEEIKEALK